MEQSLTATADYQHTFKANWITLTMNFKAATNDYEKWLAAQIELVKEDICTKHERMREALFPFLRATFYRWMQLWPEVCAELTVAPVVLAVGDLHIENFGTWRDIDGRLVWGLNDFDEAWPLPYTVDLVRVAASVQVAIDATGLNWAPADAYAAILEGYQQCLESGGKPFVLAEKSGWLRELALKQLRDPVPFWNKMMSLPKASGSGIKPAAALLKYVSPQPITEFTLLRRVAGLGSLGHPRFVALGRWHGGLIAREAKKLSASACVWAAQHKKPAASKYTTVLSRAVRCPDPTVSVKQGWLLRRLAPDCTKLDLSAIPTGDTELHYFRAIGRETANVHLGSARATKLVAKDLATRQKKNPKWLKKAADDMLHALRKDFDEWRKT